MSDRLTEELRSDEGEKLFAYQDHLGFWTIGVGILIDQRKGGGITSEESSYLLANRIASKRAELTRRLPWFTQLDPVRQDGLLNMAFQMGVDGLLKFNNSLEMIRTQQWQAASQNLHQSEWAKQTPARAERVIAQIVTGNRR